MSFGDHLDELRRRVIWALALPLPAAIIAFFFANTLLGWLLLPLFEAQQRGGLKPTTQVLGPAEAILTQIKLSLIAALIVSAPWILWQAWKFIAPGLYQHERRFVHLLIPGSALMSVLGVLLMYFWMLPLMLTVMVAIGNSMAVSMPQPEVDPRVEAVLAQRQSLPLYVESPESPAAGTAWVTLGDMRLWVAVQGDGKTNAVEVIEASAATRGVLAQEFRLSEYINFALLLFLAIVIAFQMPLVVLLLGWVGLASVDWLRQRRKYALFGCAIAAAVLTPSADMLSMLLFMAPLYGLYELGILLLVMLPARHVAEGSVFNRSRWRSASADKALQPAEHFRPPSQTDQTVARQQKAGVDGEDLPSEPADGEGSAEREP